GDIDLLGTVPNGQLGILLPRRMLPVVASRAVLGGQDLGEPVRARGESRHRSPASARPPGVRLGHGVLRRCAVMTRATSPEAKPTPAEPRLPAPGTPSRIHWAVFAICALPRRRSPV